jgi:GH24 family phage-related lysozyme (muramidase)
MQPQNSKPRKTLVAILGAGTAAALIAFTAPQEGLSLKPYKDRLANNLMTVCYGETNVEMRTYTKGECDQMLAESLAEYAAPVKDLTPNFDRLTGGQQIAAIDFTYNHGVEAYRGSTLRRRYSASDFPGACAEFHRWAQIRVHGQLRSCEDPANDCRGLWNRANLQRKACEAPK